MAHKTAVFGIVERKGRVAAATVDNASKASLMPHIQKRVLPGDLIYTDEFQTYDDSAATATPTGASTTRRRST